MNPEACLDAFHPRRLARRAGPAGPLAAVVLLASAVAGPTWADGSGAAATPAVEAPQSTPGAEPGVDRRLYVYGYFSTRLEKTLNEPAFSDGRVVSESAPAEWSHPFVHVMLQHRMGDRFKAFLNLNGSGAGNLDIRNMWGEYAPSPAFTLRVGKIYRHFGLYNEILDAVPTYFGIEPPELFDADHLILSRTSNFMVLGDLRAGSGQLRYSFTTDHGEGDPVAGTYPVGGDLRYTSGDDRFVVGTSFYSSNGDTTPDLDVGQGSPKSGVLPWMEADSFKVYGGYGQFRGGPLTLQAEYWRAPHQARRDPARTVTMVRGAKPNPAQLARFLRDPGQAVSEANVATDARYTVETWYLRGGYSARTRIGQIEPYAQWDRYENPETVGKKKFGGDNEAGVADDGAFHKATLGLVFRPIPEVAIKLDGSSHIYRFHGRRVHYEEVRFDVSVVFGQ